NPQTSEVAWELLGRGYFGMEDWTPAAIAFDRAAIFRWRGAGMSLAAAQSCLPAARAKLPIDRPGQARPVQDRPEAWLVLGKADLQLQALAPLGQRRWERSEAARRALTKTGAAAIAAPWRIDFWEADYLALRAASELQPFADPLAAAEILRKAEAK